MSSLIARLAYDRIDRSRLFVTYAVGLAVGAVLAVLVLAGIGVFTIP
jgi:hypothetical protein